MADPETTGELVQKALIAGNVCAFVSAGVNPLDVTKIRLQNQQQHIKYRGMLSGAMLILKEEGLAGWAKGLTASMLREVTYSSVRIGAYEPIRSLISSYIAGPNAEHHHHHTRHLNQQHNHNHGRSSSPAVKYFSALLSGGGGAALASPLDLIKVPSTWYLVLISCKSHVYRTLVEFARPSSLSSLPLEFWPLLT